MARLKLGEFVRPLEPIEWPDGTEQAVKHLTWVEQEMLADMEADAVSVRDTMPKLMPLLLPGRTWAEISAALDMEAMRAVLAYASGKYDEAMRAMEATVGKVPAGTDPASPPPTPAPTSSVASPAPTAAPSGAS